MSLFTKPGYDIAAPVDSAGNPRSVVNHDMQVWMTEAERGFLAFVAGGGIVFPDKATMDATLTYAANQMAWVLGDAVVANNGVYQKIGASGTGSWSRRGDLPYSHILASNVGAGTANAIVATTPIPIPVADGGALVALPILAPNSVSPVTVSFNGDTPLTIKTLDGGDVAVNGLVPSVIWGTKVGSTFRLISAQRGWSPLERSVSDGARRVREVYDWTGGDGLKPAATGYLSPAGYTQNIALATDYRGEPGPAGPGTGDMLAAVYDPASVAANAFDGMSVANRTQLKALDPTLFDLVQLIEPGREGAIYWSGGDLSSILTPFSATSSAIDASTDTVTSVDHGLRTSNAVYPTTTVNGLTAETFYYAIVPNVSAINYDAETAAFTSGQVLTGGTSGATATILKVIDNDTTGTLWLGSITGTFADNEAITDAAGGAALANGIVYLTRNTDAFKLATSVANAHAGTAVDLTGTTNFTVKRYVDPEEGIYFVPSGLARDGSQGAYVRRHNGVLRPEWFGVVRIPDMSVAVASMPNSTVALGGMANLLNAIHIFPVRFSGYYKSTTLLAFTCPWLTLLGAGARDHGLLFDDSDGISLIQSFRYDHFKIDGIGFITNVDTTRKGFFYQNTEATGGDAMPRTMPDCLFIGLDRFLRDGSAATFTEGWLVNVDLIQANRLTILRTWFQGPESHRLSGTAGVWPVATFGIRVADSTHVHAEGCFWFVLDRAMQTMGQSEGSTMINPNIVACNRGFVATGLVDPANTFKISGGHISCFLEGVHIALTGGGGSTTTFQHIVEGTVFFKRPDSTAAGYKHIRGRCDSLLSRGNYYFHPEATDALASDDRVFHVETGKWTSVGDVFQNEARLTTVATGASMTLIDGYVIDNAKSILETNPLRGTGTNIAFGFTGSRADLINRNGLSQFLAAGSKLDWGAGDVTITHQTNRLDFAGADQGYRFDRPIGLANFSLADLGNIAHAVNTTYKFTGAMVWVAATGLSYIATGGTAGSNWQPSDGSAAITPA